MREDALWAAVLEVIDGHYGALLRSPGFADAVRKRAREIMARPQSHGPAVADLEAEKREIARKVQSLVENVSGENLKLLDGALSNLRLHMEELDALIAEREEADSAGEPPNTPATDQVAAELRTALETIRSASPSLKRRLVRQLVARIELDPRTKKGVAWLWRLPKSVLDSLRLPVSRIERPTPFSNFSRATKQRLD